MQESEEFKTIEIDGEILSVMSNGKMYPTISGAATDEDDGDDDHEDDEDEDGSDEDQDDDEDGDDEDGDKPRLHTEEEVRRIASKEKKDGRRAGRNAILKELGVNSVAEALRKMSGGKSQDDTSDNQDPKVLEQEMQEQRAMNRVEGKAERILIRQGVPDTPKALKAALSSLELESDFSDDDITTAVEDLKEELPALFGTETKGGRKDPPDSDAGRGKRRQKGSSRNAADDLMARRHGTK